MEVGHPNGGLGGTHVPRGAVAEATFNGKYQVADVWYTIQGEGPLAGEPAVFIRLTGCNFRCRWCDTRWDDEADPYLTSGEIVERVTAAAAADPTNWVVLTGGEPSRWPLAALMQALLAHGGGGGVQIETAGAFWQPCMQWEHVLTVVSPKVGKVAPEHYRHTKHWKYVVGAGDAINEDIGIPLAGTQAGDVRSSPATPPLGAGAQVWLQPRDDGNDAMNAANQRYAAHLCMTYGHRLSLQQHKILGLP